MDRHGQDCMVLGNPHSAADCFGSAAVAVAAVVAQDGAAGCLGDCCHAGGPAGCRPDCRPAVAGPNPDYPVDRPSHDFDPAAADPNLGRRPVARPNRGFDPGGGPNSGPFRYPNPGSGRDVGPNSRPGGCCSNPVRAANGLDRGKSRGFDNNDPNNRRH